MADLPTDLPTIRDLSARMADLIDRGLGDLPVQIVVVPDDTLQSVSQALGHSPTEKPVLMLDLVGDEGRQAVSLISTAHLSKSRNPWSRGK